MGRGGFPPEESRLVNGYTCSPEDLQDEMEAFDLASRQKPPKKIDGESVEHP